MKKWEKTLIHKWRQLIFSKKITTKVLSFGIYILFSKLCDIDRRNGPENTMYAIWFNRPGLTKKIILLYWQWINAVNFISLKKNCTLASFKIFLNKK